MADMLHSTSPHSGATASWDGAAARHRPPTVADRLAARLALRQLDGFRRGRLRLRMPDGERRILAGAAPGPDATVDVHAWSFFRRLLGGDVGAGESYMLGEWSSPDLVQAARLFIANEDALSAGAAAGLVRRGAHRLRHVLRANTRAGARRCSTWATTSTRSSWTRP